MEQTEDSFLEADQEIYQEMAEHQIALVVRGHKTIAEARRDAATLGVLGIFNELAKIYLEN